MSEAHRAARSTQRAQSCSYKPTEISRHIRRYSARSLRRSFQPIGPPQRRARSTTRSGPVPRFQAARLWVQHIPSWSGLPRPRRSNDPGPDLAGKLSVTTHAGMPPQGATPIEPRHPLGEAGRHAEAASPGRQPSAWNTGSTTKTATPAFPASPRRLGRMPSFSGGTPGSPDGRHRFREGTHLRLPAGVRGTARRRERLRL